MRIVGAVRTPVTLHNGSNPKHTIYVVSGLTSPLILGVDFMRSNGVTVTGDRVSLGKRQDAGTDPVVAALVAASDQWIQKQTAQLVKVCAMNPDDTGSRLCIISHATLAGWDTWVDFKGPQESQCVPMINDGDEDYLLRAGTVVGSVEAGPRMGFSVDTLEDEWETIQDGAPEPSHSPAPALTGEVLAKFHQSLRIEAPAEYRQGYEALLTDFHDVFAKNDFDIGRCKVLKHKINMVNTQPIHTRQFRIPWEHEKAIQKYVDELLARGAIEPSRSPWNSPIFCVPKPLPPGRPPPKDPAAAWRVVIDFRKVNAASEADHFAIREIKDCLDDIGKSGSSIYSSLDLQHGYFQCLLQEDSRKYTAFTVPGRTQRFQFCVAPMGAKGSGSTFGKLVGYVLQGVQGILAYVDDVLAHSCTHQEMLKTLRQVFIRFRKYNLKLNPRKSIFGTAQCAYLGYTISKDGIRPSEDKTRAIRDSKPPANLKEIRGFLGLANYFRFLIPNFAGLSAPLTQLTTKNSGYKHGPLPDQALRAYDQLKQALCKGPVVAFPRPDLRFKVTTDAASGDSKTPGGLGAMLSQCWEDGQERVVSYASRSLKGSEKNYGAFLLELAAACFGIDQFSVYLVGRKFDLVCDHKPLQALSTTQTKTLNRLQELLLQFDFNILYKPGKENAVADFLSRSVVASLKDDSGDLVQAQAADVEIRDVKGFLETGTVPGNKRYVDKVARLASKCFLEDNLVWYSLTLKGEREKYLLFTPRRIRPMILQEAHQSWAAGHGGNFRTLRRIQQLYWWPGMSNDVDEFVSRCQRCQEAKGKKVPPMPLESLPIPHGRNWRVHLDLFGPLKPGPSGNKYVMVMTDAWSKVAEVAAIPSKEAEVVARTLFDRWICRYSVPKFLLTDGGREFANQVMDSLSDKMGMRRIRISAYSPNVNSSAESYNRQIIKYLSAMLDNNSTLEWETWLPALQFSYNIHVHKSLKESPFFLTYLHDPRLPYFDLDRPRQFYAEEAGTDLFRQLRSCYQLVTENLDEAKSSQKLFFDRKAESRVFSVGDRVLVNFPQVPTGVNRKFYKTWRGLYTVTRVFSSHNLEVCKNGTAQFLCLHVNRVRHLKSPDEIREWTDAKGADSAPDPFRDSRQQPLGDHEESTSNDGHPVRSRSVSPDPYKMAEQPEVDHHFELAIPTGNTSEEYSSADEEEEEEPRVDPEPNVRVTRGSGVPVDDIPLPDRPIEWRPYTRTSR